MILLRLISWPYFRRHLLRAVLTAAGIVLGVAVFVGMHTANQAVLFAFGKTVTRIAGATQLQISAGESGFPEEVLERVQALGEVRVAAPVIEAVADTGLAGQGNLLILAVDMTGDRSLRDYEFESGEEAIIEDPLVFLAQPDSLIVTAEFAARNQLGINSRIPMRTMAGEKQFTVRGIMRSGGLTSAFGGNLAIMDVYAAQLVFGRGRAFDRIDVGVKEGARVEDVQEKLRRLLGPGFQVEPPASRGREFESIAEIYGIVASISSAFTLFIGMFIIYNTFAIAVTQRRGEIGILRALGATRAQIRTLFLVESAVTGLIGSLAGVALGIAMARAMASYLGDLLGEIYGVASRADEVSSDPRLLAGSLAIGIATSVIAAWLPARSAARVDPVRALQKGKYQVLSEGENRGRRLAALAAASMAALCAISKQGGPLLYAGFAMAVIACLLLTPALALWLAKFLRPVLRRLRPVEGTLAADSLIQAPRRTSGAVSALMLSLALVISLGGMARASFNSIHRWLETALDPDLFVGPSQTLTERSFRFPPSIGDRLRLIEGVARVQMVRTARVTLHSEPVMFVSTEIELLSDRTKREAIAGDPARMYQVAGAGDGVIISDNLALQHNLRFGQMLEIATPSGILRTPVVGIVTDYSDQKGSILIDRSLWTRYWKDDTVNLFRIYLQPGVDEHEARQRIVDRMGGESRLVVMTNRQVRDYILRITEQWFGLTYVQLAVAVLVAVLGIVNTLTVSITDRRRELGVLQAVGGLRRQIRHTIWIEALSIGTVGLALGFGLGAICLYYSLEITRLDLGGIRLDYTYPFAICAALAPIMLGAAFVAALGPAESAVRGSLVEALEYE